MSTLRDSNPQYAAVKVIEVDWDQYAKSDLTSELGIPRRSTLVMFNQGEEVARVVSQTGINEIEALFKAVI